MGWLSLSRRAATPIVSPTKFDPKDSIDTEPDCEHCEFYNDAVSERTRQSLSVKEAPGYRHFQKASVADKDLPFIEPEEVKTTERARSMGLPEWRLWIVIDDIVYDCTAFQHDHPGGKAIIQKFAGQSCGWQFWRFYSKSQLKEYGHKLRVGRTSGVRNPYKEPARYVGLRKLGDDWFDP